MNPKSITLLALLMLLPWLPLPAAATAEPPPTCDMITTKDSPVPACSVGRVVTWAKSCPRTSKSYSCPLVSQMPPAEIQCTAFNGTVSCEAWPQADALTYRYVWSVISGVAPDWYGGEYDPNFAGNCTGLTGRVAVTVIAPDGTAKSADVRFTCEYGQ